MSTQPQLGYGNTAEVSINAVNQWMRTQPWYQQLITSFGQNPNNVRLNDAQKQAVVRAAQAHGVVVDEGHNGQEVDESGNFRAVGHKLRNTLIVAGIAAASLATMGAAGVFAGGAGAAAGGGGAAAGGAAAAGGTAATAGGLTAGGLLASTTTAPLMAGTIAGSVASGAVPAALAAGGTAATAGGLLASGATVPTAAAPAGTLASYGTGAPSVMGTTAGLTPSGAVPVALSTAPKVASAFGGNNLNTALNLAGTVGGIFSNIYGTNKQIEANDRAALLQKQAADDALAFQKSAAENSYQNSEVNRRANYDQWAAREGRVSSAGASLGFGARTIPGYVAGVDPNFTGTSSGTPAASGMSADAAGQRFLAAVKQAGLDPVAMQGHGKQIADAVNKIDPSLQLSVDPKSDAIVWNGLPMDVTIDSGKGGWAWQLPNSGGAPVRAQYRPSAGSYLASVPMAQFQPLPMAPTLRAPNPYSVGSYL